MLNRKSLTKADTDLFYWLYRRTQKRNCTAIVWLSKTGDGYAQLGLPLCVYVMGASQGLSYFSAVIISFAAWLPAYWVLKNTCRRKRPPAAIPAFSAAIEG